MNTHTHTHANTHTHTHMHTKTHACTLACARVHPHTNCSFVIGDQNLWNHLPDNVKEAGYIEFFKQTLNTVVFSQSFEIPAFS